MEVDIENGNKHSNIVKKELDRIKKVGVERFQVPYKFMGKTLFLKRDYFVSLNSVQISVGDYAKISLRKGVAWSTLSFRRTKISKYYPEHGSIIIDKNNLSTLNQKISLQDILLNIKPKKECVNITRQGIVDSSDKIILGIDHSVSKNIDFKRLNSLPERVRNEMFDCMSKHFVQQCIDICLEMILKVVENKKLIAEQEVEKQSKKKKLMLKELIE